MKVRFIRDTRSHECEGQHIAGDVVDMSEISLARWLRRKAVEVVPPKPQKPARKARPKSAIAPVNKEVKI